MNKNLLSMMSSSSGQGWVSNPWNIENAQYVSEFPLSIGAPSSFHITDDGLHLYALGVNGVLKYTFGSAFDITTLSYVGRYLTSMSFSTTSTNIYVDESGTYLFLLDDSANDIHAYTMSVAHDIDTISFWYSETSGTYNKISACSSFVLNSSGTIAIGTQSNRLTRGVLSSAWDLRTYTETDYKTTAEPYDVTVENISVDSTGTKLGLFRKLYGGIVLELDSAWSISSYTVTSSYYTDTQAYKYQLIDDVVYILKSNASLDILQLSASWNVGNVYLYSGGYDPTQTSTFYGFHVGTTKAWIVYNATVWQYSYDGGVIDSSALSYDSVSLTLSNSSRGICFSDDFSKMYTCYTTGIDMYTLSTPGDLSSASYTSTLSLSYATRYSIRFYDSGTRMMFTENGNTVRMYTLSTAWDLSTATLSSSLSSIQAYSCCIDSSGTRLYLGYRYNIIQYTLSTAWNLSTATPDSYFINLGNSTRDGYVYDIQIDEGNSRMLYTDTATDDIIQLNYDTSIDSDNIYTFEYYYSNSPTLTKLPLDWEIYKDFKYGDSGNKIYLVYNYNEIHQYSLASAYDIKTIDLDTKVVSPSFTQSIYGIDFNSDGTKLIVSDYNTLYEFTLSSGFDISTLNTTYNQSFFIGSQYAFKFYFVNSGSKLITLSANEDKVKSYTVSTPYNINTLSDDGNDFSTSTEDTSPTSLYIDNTGTKMYVGGSSTRDVHYYILSTAFNPSSAVHQYSLDIPSSSELTLPSPLGILFNNNGDKMYILNTYQSYSPYNILEYEV